MSKVEITEHHGVTFLWIDGKMWMWDLPEEVKIQKELARQAYGDVLVVGLGLGIIQRFLAKNKMVMSVETVEEYEEVRHAYFCHFNEHTMGHVIIDDFYNLPDPSYQRWDCVIGDLWLEIHPNGLEQYKKFYEKAQTLIKPNGKIIGWGQEYYEYLISKEGAKND